MESMITLLACLCGFALGWLAFGRRRHEREKPRRVWRRRERVRVRVREPTETRNDLQGFSDDEFTRELAELMAYDGGAGEESE